jgi:hypothetical protein
MHRVTQARAPFVEQGNRGQIAIAASRVADVPDSIGERQIASRFPGIPDVPGEAGIKLPAGGESQLRNFCEESLAIPKPGAVDGIIEGV